MGALRMNTNKGDDVKRRAALFWSMDLEEIESALGVEDVVNTLPVDKIDGRVPPQGSVLWENIEYLPKEK